MALVLPTLRLSVLLLNVYTTFKAMKPPPRSQRSAGNKLAPSGKAMQYRKRELKSCLAVWVVWSFFFTAEGVFDHTFGLVTPFYSELKCLALLFLLLARAPGAEAIFLHVIHPLLRPYVPAIDDALANIYSVIDLFLLLLSLPLEYASYWWYRWKGGEDGPPSHDDERGGRRELRQERMVLRPRRTSQQGNRREQYHAALQHTSIPRIDVNSHDDNQHSRKSNTAKGGPPPPTVRLRTRRNILEYPPGEGQDHGPGSRTTGMHYIYGAALNELPPAPSLPPFPSLPAAPTANPNISSHQPRPSVDHSYRIWHPPRATFVEDGEPLPRDTPLPSDRRMPAAYPFTPRFSDPLPPPPFIINPPQLASPTPRRVSTGTPSSRQVFDERTARSSGQTRQPVPSRNARSAEPQGTRREEYFFGQALEPSISIQSAEMEIDTETLSVRDDSSADDENAEVATGAHETEVSEVARGGRRVTRSNVREDKEGQQKLSMTAKQSRRGLPKNVNESLNPGTDEFGFTIRQSSQTLDRVSAANSGDPKAGASKKPLARTKSELVEDGGDDESPDEKSRKKRQRSTLSADANAEDGKNSHQSEELGSSPLSRRGGGVRRRGKRRTAVQRADESRHPDQMRVSHNHATRASARLAAEGEPLHRRGATRRRGK